MITNCDIKIDDINRADIIWRPEEYVLKEKNKIKKDSIIPKVTLPISVWNPVIFIKNRKTELLSVAKMKSRSGREIQNAIDRNK